MATIREIAASAGVSAATVSRVLNNDEKFSVSEETREKIIRMAQSMGYKKSGGKGADNVAFLYWFTENEELEDVYYKRIRMEIEKEAKVRNIVVKRYTKEEGIDAIAPNTDALLMVGWFTKNEIQKMTSITHNGIILDTSPYEEIYDSVRPNLRLMIQQMVDYYIANGHRKIGLICRYDYDLHRQAFVPDTRETAFREIMQEYGLLRENYVLRSESGSVSGGYQCALRAIEQLGDDLPTAFCVASDPLAIGALQAFNEHRIAIPQRTSFFSIDDINVSKYVSPPLSTFHIDIPLLCQSALDLLQERLHQNRTTPKTVLIAGEPVFRKSIKAFE